jgi:hypothetical protein
MVLVQVHVVLVLRMLQKKEEGSAAVAEHALIEIEQTT